MTKRCGQTRRARRGSAYVLVLLTVGLVSLTAMSAIALRKSELRQTLARNEIAAARAYAHAAIELGLRMIEEDPANWRTALGNGAWLQDVPFETGAFSLYAYDPVDNDVTNSDTDPLVLRGVGVTSRARQMVELRLEAEEVPRECIRYAAHAHRRLRTNSIAVYSDHTLSSSLRINVTSGSTMEADLIAPELNVTGGSSHIGDFTQSDDEREMPDDDAFEYYVQNGTHIPISDIPTDADGNREITAPRRFVLDLNLWLPEQGPHLAPEPANPPEWFDPDRHSNPDGIFVIDCEGQDLRIYQIRIEGTLVVLNPGSNSIIESSLNWTPAVTGYPILLVDGGMDFHVSSSDFRETSGIGSTSFPSELGGLIYVTDDALVRHATTIRGMLVGGRRIDIEDGTNITFLYDETTAANPPPGFRDPPRMRIIRGGFSRAAN